MRTAFGDIEKHKAASTHRAEAEKQRGTQHLPQALDPRCRGRQRNRGASHRHERHRQGWACGGRPSGRPSWRENGSSRQRPEREDKASADKRRGGKRIAGKCKDGRPLQTMQTNSCTHRAPTLTFLSGGRVQLAAPQSSTDSESVTGRSGRKAVPAAKSSRNAAFSLRLRSPEADGKRARDHSASARTVSSECAA
jgi:hypothetical protein